MKKSYRCSNGHDVTIATPFERFTCPCGAEQVTTDAVVVHGHQLDPHAVRIMSVLGSLTAQPVLVPRAYWAALVAGCGISMLVGLFTGYWLHG